MKVYQVPHNILQATLDYLVTRPWREVNDLMRAYEKIAAESNKEPEEEPEEAPKEDEQG